MSKKRITIRVDEDEIAVVGSIALWEHLIDLYEIMARQYPENEAKWLDARDWIKESISKSNKEPFHD